ncbi:hypothetical protein [Secundilactobacillus kimchicus]|uniref:hypothetical protein n=1 Tax=Secundilactobacillus kimchicus TaxID=528209 RepID=UPI0024A7C725|nr:hypothetical protein [Secundilactobacillus kimchicus]
MSKFKTYNDINFQQLIHQQPVFDHAANFLVAIAGDKESLETYGALADVAEVYDESTRQYKVAEEWFNHLAENENTTDEPISIGTYVDQDQPDPMAEVLDAPVVKSIETTDTTATITAEAAKVPLVNGLVHFLTNYFQEGWRFVFAPEADETTQQAVMDYLYENQQGILLVEVADTATATAYKTYADKYTDKNKFVPVMVLADKDGQEVAAGAAAVATVTVPVNWRRIGNLSGITDNNWLAPEIAQLDQANADPIVNKSGDFMLLHGRALDGHYMDNVFGTQYVYGYMTAGVQKWLDRPEQRFFKFNDVNLSKLKAEAELLGSQLAAMGFFAEGDDGKAIFKVTVPSRNQTSQSDVEKRRTKMVIDYTLANLIDTVDGQINVTV